MHYSWLVRKQCAIPVFDRLLPDHCNDFILELLFICTHWNGLAKLCLHSDSTLDIMDDMTAKLGSQFHEFHDKICPQFQTYELPCEVVAHQRHCSKQNHHSGENSVAQFSKDPHQKIFNLDTYKYHSLGNYTSTIHRFGTTNSYSTTTVCGLFCTNIVHSHLHTLPLRGNLSTACPSHIIFTWITKHLSNNWQKLSGGRSIWEGSSRGWHADSIH